MNAFLPYVIAIPPTLAAFVAYREARKSKETANAAVVKLDDIHKQINSQQDKLIIAVKEAANLQGRADLKEEQNGLTKS